MTTFYHFAPMVLAFFACAMSVCLIFEFIMLALPWCDLSPEKRAIMKNAWRGMMVVSAQILALCLVEWAVIRFLPRCGVLTLFVMGGLGRSFTRQVNYEKMKNVSTN